jgi:hypothetical protein
MRKRFFAVVGFVFCSVLSFAQTDFNKQFFNAKQFFREGKYNLAMEAFKPLIPYDQNNPFSEYASFYYAVSAYHQGFKAVAKDQFSHIKTVYPRWDKMDEVNFWLGKIHIENSDFFQGLKVFSLIKDKGFQKDIDAVKRRALRGVSDIETLKMMREEYPRDEIIGRSLATQLSNDLGDPASKALLEEIIRAYGFKRAEFIPEAPKSFEKQKYAVSIIMPFMVNTLEPTPTKKRNQIVLDFYEGVRLAVDTLNAEEERISLRAYDTERNNSKLKGLLELQEIKTTDLIIGPFFQEESKPILEFALANKVNVINPFANNSELTENNPYSYLFQPSTETLGKESGEFLAGYVQKKNCFVFFGTNRRDSLLARSFMQTARDKGMRIVGSRGVPKDNVRSILSMLTTGTEFDDFRNPKEFTLKKDSLGSIFVASDDPLLYAKVISAIETRGDKIVVLGSESWLEHTIVDFEKYQTLPIVLAAPNFVSNNDPEFIAFVKKYIKIHGRVPSDHARLGFEVMMFAGRQLKENGVYFQDALNRKNFVPGFLYQGYNFQYTRSNQFIPFIRYQDNGFKVIENP